MAIKSSERQLCDSLVAKRFGKFGTVYNDKRSPTMAQSYRRLKYVGVKPTIRQCNNLQKKLNEVGNHDFVVLPAIASNGLYSNWSSGLRIYIFDK